jgi:hypothetical protein
MKTIFQKNTRWISGTSYPGILTIKKNRDVDNNKAQFRILDTWLEDELILSRLPDSPDKKTQSVPMKGVLAEQAATISEQVFPSGKRWDCVA